MRWPAEPVRALGRAGRDVSGKPSALILAVAIAFGVVACDGGDRRGTTPEAAPTASGPPGTAEPSLVAGSIDPSVGQGMELFEVDADHAEYWRMFTLDRYDGELWTSTNPGGSEGGVTLSAPATLPGSGGGTPPGAETLIHTFRILSDFESAHSLPMAQTAEEIAGSVGEITWDPARSQAFIHGPLEAGMEYAVRSRIVVPTPEELDRVDHLAPRTYGQWTELPAELDPKIGAMAERWSAAATSSYRKVLAIQEHFHNGEFAYSTDVEAGADVDSLLAFLTRTRVGFCQHYTAAMTVMVRELGLPARIAVGFRPGTQQEDGGFLVRTGDAHVWVEVLFPGYGWLQFEPEPGPAPHPNAKPGTYLHPAVSTDTS
ncbi:MAG TPA: transglutaminaseTgpA domain-containing protein [Actinomycetota bacterium]|nr:transglutaminaseTgpA domain-containing protein [Actinomycetota bacterium]